MWFSALKRNEFGRLGQPLVVRHVNFPGGESDSYAAYLWDRFQHVRHKGDAATTRHAVDFEMFGSR